MRCRYFDPATERTVAAEVSSVQDLAGLIEAVREFQGGRGVPALELSDEKASTLTLGIAGQRAIVLWADPLDATFHSVSDFEGNSLIFDYFGSYTEVPAGFSVPIGAALRCAEYFLNLGTPINGEVTLEPDWQATR